MSADNFNQQTSMILIDYSKIFYEEDKNYFFLVSRGVVQW